MAEYLRVKQFFLEQVEVPDRARLCRGYSLSRKAAYEKPVAD